MKYFTNIKTLEIDKSKCIGCGRCVEVCPHLVFEIVDKIAIATNLELCMECGACKLNCPANAIKVESGVGCVAAVVNGFINNSEPD